MMVSLVLMSALWAGQAERPPTTPAPESSSPESSTAEKTRVAKAYVGNFRVALSEESADPADGLDVPMIDHPLMTYGDPARDNDNGTLWAWGRKGRPKFFLELYQSGGNRRHWAQAITLTSTDGVIVDAPGNQRWSPKPVAIAPIVVDAPQPAESDRLRLRQMKEIAARLSAHELWDPNNSRYELRLLIQPVHRYADPERGIVDGATFVLAHGTNPEILVFLEAAGKEASGIRWRMFAARLGSAELHLHLDDKEIWNRPRTPNIVGQPSEPYWLFFTNVAPPAPASSP